ncbi:hypothetical protein [Deinococcus sp. QL22]|uniref:hypothetical protein n=1 Tax=Deinococcus sp. QL22 TaxID=2939437 RepID=UPI002017F070|nr:hypothetical protein [Deinococcus sp. QL22]UQN09262.1 hypothetical protein M1R55_22055 [Deinococcus sp. QL22]
MNKRTALLMMAALSLTPVIAQVVPAPTTVTLPHQIPNQIRDAWGTFLAAGGSASLLDALGAVIGTVNPDGTLTLSAGKTLSDVKAVRLQPKTGEATTVNVARDLSRPGAIKIEWMGPNGQVQSLPLPAVVNRATRTAAVTPPTAPPHHEDKGEKSEKTDKSDSNPGKGKGKS